MENPDVQRQANAAADFADGSIEGDVVFFEQHPDRSYRVRYASPIEIEMIGTHPRASAALQPGDCWFVLVRKFRPSAILRVLFPNPAGPDTANASDQQLEAFFPVLRVAPEFCSLEAAMQSGEHLGDAWWPRHSH